MSKPEVCEVPKLLFSRVAKQFPWADRVFLWVLLLLPFQVLQHIMVLIVMHVLNITAYTCYMTMTIYDYNMLWYGFLLPPLADIVIARVCLFIGCFGWFAMLSVISWILQVRFSWNVALVSAFPKQDCVNFWEVKVKVKFQGQNCHSENLQTWQPNSH